MCDRVRSQYLSYHPFRTCSICFSHIGTTISTKFLRNAESSDYSNALKRKQCEKCYSRTCLMAEKLHLTENSAWALLGLTFATQKQQFLPKILLFPTFIAHLFKSNMHLTHGVYSNTPFEDGRYNLYIDLLDSLCLYLDL